MEFDELKDCLLNPNKANEKICNDFSRYVARRARKYLSKYKFNDQDIEDFVQDVWMFCIKGVSKYQSKAPFEHYINGIITNLLKGVVRKRSQGMPYVELPENYRQISQDELDLDEVVAKESCIHIIDIINKLENENKKNIIILKLKMLSNTEISKLLGIPKEDIPIKLHRARKYLARELKKAKIINF